MSSSSVVVQKYGGSSVADVDRLKRVAARVACTRAAGHAVVVVVSAMGNTTNELLNLARRVSSEPGRRELDMLLSVGERITMALLSMAINDLGVPAVSFTGSQSGILTDDRHAGARIVEVRPERIRKALDDGRVAIVAGFQGMSRSREITTLGRGGSDTTAVALAAALGAEVCEILTDVDGVFSADPRQVADAHRIDALSYGEALALFRGGARVLHPEAVAWAAKAGIVLHTGLAEPGPDGWGRGTDIRSLVPREDPHPVAVAADADLEIARPGPGGMAELLRWCAEVEAPVRFVYGSFALLDRRDFHHVDTVTWPKGATHEPGGLLTVAGTGGGTLPNLLFGETVMKQLGIEAVYCEMDGDRLCWLLPSSERGRLGEAATALHRALVAP
jgi:aspartate kinase